MNETSVKKMLDRLNGVIVANTKAFHGSEAVANLYEGIFATADGKRYYVNERGEIRKHRKVARGLND